MRAFTSTRTPAEIAEEIERLDDASLQRKLRTIREARKAGDNVTYVVWNYADSWHPHIDAAFDNRSDAESWVKMTTDAHLSWDVLVTHRSIASALAYENAP